MADPTHLESCTASRGAKVEGVGERLGHPFSRLGPPLQEHGRSFTGPWHYDLGTSISCPEDILYGLFLLPGVHDLTRLPCPRRLSPQNALNRTGCMFSVPRSGSVQNLILGNQE